MASNTKTALLNAAERVARARGYDGFSYADLAADVGIRKASIHHHFPAKSDLSVALMQRYAEEIKAACGAIEARETTGAARLSSLIAHYRAALRGGESLCLCVAFSANPDTLPDDVIAEIDRFRDFLLSWLAETFREGTEDGTIAPLTDPDQEAAATLAVLEGAQLAARAVGAMAPFDAATSQLRARLG